MAKDPAFLFYSKDWIEGTIEMLPEEKGVYIDLLAHQHQKGSLPIETNRLCRLVCMQENEFLKIWPHIKNKFIEIEITDEPNGSPNGTPNGCRLVNQKLFELTNQRKMNAYVNKITGTFAALIKNAKCTDEEKDNIKKLFNNTSFIGVSEDDIKYEVTKWFNECCNSILPNGIPNGLPNGIPKNNQTLTSLANANENKDIDNKEKENVLKNSNLFRQPKIPSKDQVWEFFSRNGATKDMAKSFYEKYEATGWFLNGAPIINWNTLASRFITNWNNLEASRKAPRIPETDNTKVKIKLK